MHPIIFWLIGSYSRNLHFIWRMYTKDIKDSFMKKNSSYHPSPSNGPSLQFLKENSRVAVINKTVLEKTALLKILASTYKVSTEKFYDQW